MYRILLLLAVLATGVTQNMVLFSTLQPVEPSGTKSPWTNIRQKVTAKPRRQDSVMLNYIFDSYATSNRHFHDKLRPPSFEDEESPQVKLDADTGATVIFDCKVTALRDKKVSWLRETGEDNLQLLTVDMETHTTDRRYRVALAGDNWRLSLSNATVNDSGVYCCHVSTHPPMLKHVNLTVHAPFMLMVNDAYLETSETLSLKCIVMHLQPGKEEPRMRWYKNNSTIPVEELRGGVSIENDHLLLASHLQVARLKVEDAGNYTCSLEAPMRMSTVARVHVLKGSSLAELQSGVRTTKSYMTLLLASNMLALWRYEVIR